MSAVSLKVAALPVDVKVSNHPVRSSLSVRTGLAWAILNDRPIGPVWMGIGLTSDRGLPFDALSMFLTATAIQKEQGDVRPVLLLLGDAHAKSTGIDAGVVQARVNELQRNISRISQLIKTDIHVIQASDLDRIGRFRDTFDFVKSKNLPTGEYVVRGVADVLYFSDLGMSKVGWSRHPDLREGGHDERETDRFAEEIDPSVVSAVYVPHGRPLDPARCAAPPYTEPKDAKQRLMLTGLERGGFRAKLSECPHKVARRVLEYVSAIVQEFEHQVGELGCGDELDKAEEIVRRFHE